MKRSETHQIDELAKRIFLDSLPPTWVCNEQHSDYGKDFLVEIADHDGTLTGNSFFVQLKGQKNVRTLPMRDVVTFSLKTKYSRYYIDQIRDLPVFLVVVDINRNCGWWLFLQRHLFTDRSWRNRRSQTFRIPLNNRLDRTAILQRAVETAKDWMRRQYPEFHTPFLQQCFDYLCVEHGLPEATVIDNGIRERMHIPYFPTRPDEVPVFESSVNTWLFNGREPDCVHFDIYSDGRFDVSPCDDDGHYFSVHIKNPEEIGDLMHLINSLNSDSVLCDNSKIVPLSHLLTSVKSLVPAHDDYALVSLPELVASNPEVALLLKLLLDPNYESWEELADHGFNGWDNWCRDNITLRLTPIPPEKWTNICVYSRMTGVTTYRRWLGFDRNYRGTDPPFAIERLTDTCSAMFLCDWFNESSTGQSQLKTILNTWQDFVSTASRMTIDCPATLLEQIRRTVEARMSHGPNPGELP